MHFSAFTLLSFLALADVALSICPGFNYGISNFETVPGNNPGRDAHVWTIFDDSCNDVGSFKTFVDGNPCTADRTPFGCSPPPIIFNKLTFRGQDYACRPNPNGDSCRAHTISVCCRNDGH
ncbi:hypothetical protein BDN72DRAFT_860902 [Pluteus cervinus]|uniref:Uncharacterized protein n=1 Tax=Pluteus cervinus TaxID=181527 RepID=A0ACD3AGS6_9AGAR|nr:hypothetical protein BDN72DRAFT_860902 [Pluteus cervinus]